MEIDRTRADAECPCGLLAGGAPNDLSQGNTFLWSQSLMPGERLRQDVQCAIPMKRMPVWRSAESSSGASASALDGSELALRRLLGGRRDIHHGYLHRGVRGARFDIRQQCHMRRGLLATSTISRELAK